MAFRDRINAANTPAIMDPINKIPNNMTDLNTMNPSNMTPSYMMGPANMNPSNMMGPSNMTPADMMSSRYMLGPDMMDPNEIESIPLDTSNLYIDIQDYLNVMNLLYDKTKDTIISVNTVLESMKPYIYKRR